MTTLHFPGCKPKQIRTSSTERRKDRRNARRHAKQIERTLPEKAAIWRRRARNG